MSEERMCDSRSVSDILPTKESESSSESMLNHVDNKESFTTDGKPNYILEYIHKIESGEIVANKRITKVYSDLRDRIINPDQEDKHIFDIDKGLHAIEFIEKFCKHSKGSLAGKPFILELFQKAMVQATFSFVDKETGFRQYNEVFYYIPRKQGKTTLGSAIALYLLIGDLEQGAEIYVVATKKDQARKTYEESYNMVLQNPVLNKYVKRRQSDMYFEPTLSKYMPLSKDSNSLDGLNVSGVIMDEIHAWKDRNLYEVMKQGTSSRDQPLTLITTTAGTVIGSVFTDLYSYACDVADGEIVDDKFLPILYELDDKMEYLDPTKWQKCTPSLGSIKGIEYLEEQLRRAKHNPTELKGILTKDFNVISTSSDTWLDYEDIVNEATFDLKDFRDFYAVGGVDLSIRNDLTSASIIIVERETEIKYIHQMNWLPEEGFQKRCQIENDIPYQIWYERGFLRLTKGNTIDYTDVTKWFNEVVETYGIKIYRVHYDRYNAGYFVKEMGNYGYDMIATPQGNISFSNPMKLLEADLVSKKINYNNNPMIAWFLNNTAINIDNNDNIRPVKKYGKDSKYKIDGVVSILNAMVGILNNYQEIVQAQPR